MHKLLAAAASMLFLSAFQQPVEKVDVSLADFSFSPRELRLQSGHSYELTFTNIGSGGHNFSAPDFFSRAAVSRDSIASISKGRVELHKGERKVVKLTPVAGAYKVKCSHFMHTAFGMKGSIVVE